MKVYEDGFLLLVTTESGKTLQETNGKVDLPFGDKFSIKLRNKNNKDAVCHLFVNGESVIKNQMYGGIIVRANSTIKIDRFIDNLDEGEEFRFVKLSSGKVKDAGEPENGCIEARFYLLKEEPKIDIIKRIDEIRYVPYYPISPWQYPYPYYPYYPYTIRWNDNWVWTDHTVTNGTYCNTTGGVEYKPSVSISERRPLSDGKLRRSMKPYGAVVEGNVSKQKFESSPTIEVEKDAVILKIALVGYEQKHVEPSVLCCKTCDFVCDYNTKYTFCPKCGDRLIK